MGKLLEEVLKLRKSSYDKFKIQIDKDISAINNRILKAAELGYNSYEINIHTCNVEINDDLDNCKYSVNKEYKAIAIDYLTKYYKHEGFKVTTTYNSIPQCIHISWEGMWIN